jgi:hypothetical protein
MPATASAIFQDLVLLETWGLNGMALPDSDIKACFDAQTKWCAWDMVRLSIPPQSLCGLPRGHLAYQENFLRQVT